MKVVLLGLSITSSWGNGHATNYRALVRALRERGHQALFLERDMPWYAASRDEPGAGELYGSLDELDARFGDDVRDADVVVVGSFVPEGVAVAAWALDTAGGVVAFYDIDTPVTLGKLEEGDEEYLSPELVPRFDLYLSFTGGPTLDVLERRWGARRAEAFHCLVDERRYRPLAVARRWLLGYLGTWSDDRQPVLERLLLEPARRLPDERFVVAGPQYPASICWPPNVERIEHLPPVEHPAFYSAQAFTLNVTRAAMVRAGWSPSVRLFEAAACDVPVISDRWDGLAELLPEVLIADDADDVVRFLELGTAPSARARVLAGHTAAARVAQLERLVAGAWVTT
jgi:spore maturation protein CgeB